jgi:hypothetical protein
VTVMSIRDPELEPVAGPAVPVSKWEEGDEVEPNLDPTELDDPEELDDDELFEDDEFPEEDDLQTY